MIVQYLEEMVGEQAESLMMLLNYRCTGKWGRVSPFVQTVNRVGWPRSFMMTRFLSLVLVLSAMTSFATADVVHVADESSTGSGWRTSTVVKSNDVDGDNVYGTDGWYWFGYTNAGLDYYSGGISIPADATHDRSSLPTYISSVSYSGSNGANQWGAANTGDEFASFDDPLNIGTVKKGSIIYGPDNGNLVITIARTASSPAFRLTTFVSDNLSGYSEGISVSNGSGKDASTTIVPDKSTAQYSIFDISAGSGNVTITLNKIAVDQAMLTGLAFDHAVPEPSAIALMATGLFSLICYAWRKRP
jgi:hypothetical protein